uniref:Blastomyces yeast phase-specific protein 1 n=1 Tax=Ajellomyces dermatitidis TaxID=5039 RepID=Q9P436_AJEDE|nr:blastomyces yeast phase-specific protein 1 [Blastomyces dermatitidis]
MHLSSIFIGALTALISVVHAGSVIAKRADLGSAFVFVYCNFSVALDIQAGETSTREILDGRSYDYHNEKYRRGGGDGVSLTLHHTDGPDSSNSETTFRYKLADDNSTVEYSLGNSGGNPFAGHKITLKSSGDGCPNIEWPEGIPTGVSSGSCGSSENSILTLCPPGTSLDDFEDE